MRGNMLGDSNPKGMLRDRICWALRRRASVYTDFASVHAGGRPAVGSLGATSVATDMAMGRPNLHNDFALVYVCFGA